MGKYKYLGTKHYSPASKFNTLFLPGFPGSYRERPFTKDLRKMGFNIYTISYPGIHCSGVFSPREIVNKIEKAINVLNDIAQNTIKSFGEINALVNAVGIVKSVPFEQINTDNAYDEFNVNVLGPIFAMQAVIPYMLKNKKQAKIVNVSSLRGIYHLSSQRSILYSLSKASLHSLVSALAKKYSPKILINCIAPGFTLTSMSSSWSSSTWKSVQNNFFKRPAKPEEIANHIFFLFLKNAPI